MKVVTYRAEFVGPDLPVPLSPLRGPRGAVRRYLVWLREPGFLRARVVTVVWAVVTGAVALTSLLLPSAWRGAAVACAVLLGVYLLVRTFALASFERLQWTFQRRWLEAQSEVLRGHAFDVLRFTVQALPGVPDERRVYDLTRPADVRDLFRRRDRERGSGPISRVTVEFAYWQGAEKTMAVERVSRDLAELTFQRRQADRAHASVRFPEARYLGRPADETRLAERTRWILSGPVVVSVAGSAQGSTDAGGSPGSSAAR